MDIDAPRLSDKPAPLIQPTSFAQSALDEVYNRAQTIIQEYPVTTAAVAIGACALAVTATKGKLWGSAGLSRIRNNEEWLLNQALLRESARRAELPFTQRIAAALSPEPFEVGYYRRAARDVYQRLHPNEITLSNQQMILGGVLALSGAELGRKCYLEAERSGVEREQRIAEREAREIQEVKELAASFDLPGPNGTLWNTLQEEGKVSKTRLMQSLSYDLDASFLITPNQRQAVERLLREWDSAAVMKLRAATSSREFVPHDPIDRTDPMYRVNPWNRTKPWNYRNVSRLTDYFTADSIEEASGRKLQK